MGRTAEQKAADDALTEAIEAVRRAYDTEGVASSMTMAEYVVVTSLHGWDNDGDGITSVVSIFRDDDVPTHRAIGLLQYALGDLDDYRRNRGG